MTPLKLVLRALHAHGAGEERMTDKELMQQALEALEEIADEVFSAYDNKLGEVILALRERLAQHEAMDQLIADSPAMGAYSLDQIKAVLRQDDPQFDERMQQARERLAQPEREPWPDEPFGHIAGGVQKPEQDGTCS